MSGPGRQRGVGLVELMIGMTLGLLLLAVVLQILLSSRQAYSLTQEQSRMQENLRYAFHFMLRDLQRSAQFGCLSLKPPLTNTLNPGNGYDFDYLQPLRGYDGDGGGWQPTGLPSEITALADPDSDVLAIRGADDGEAIPVTPPYMPTTSAALHAGWRGDLQQGDIVVVNDCEAAAIMQVTNLTQGGGNFTLVHNTGAGVQPGNATSDLGRRYGEGAMISRLSSLSYFIAWDAQGEPGLYRRHAGAAAELLIPRVERMQLLYGIDESTPGARDYSANRYLNARDVGDWGRVVSLRVALLLRSDERVSGERGSRAFVLLDELFNAPDDRRLRREFSTTLHLRNRAR